jgi:aspartate/methionine/tyrosine aminotransferase
VFAEVDLPMPTRAVVERIRQERSVLLVPGEMFGIDSGIRFGFGYDVQHTLKGLALAGETLASLA